MCCFLGSLLEGDPQTCRAGIGGGGRVMHMFSYLLAFDLQSHKVGYMYIQDLEV